MHERHESRLESTQRVIQATLGMRTMLIENRRFSDRCCEPVSVNPKVELTNDEPVSGNPKVVFINETTHKALINGNPPKALIVVVQAIDYQRLHLTSVDFRALDLTTMSV